MKRFFFLFIFISFGFGAFGQIDSVQFFNNDTFIHSPDDAKYSSNPKKMEAWYVLSSDDYYLRLNLINWSHMKLQDQFHTPFVYSGHGLITSFSAGTTRKKIHMETGMELQLIRLLPSDPDERELVQNFTEGNDNWFSSFSINSSNLAHRIGTSPHYAGLNFSFTIEEYSFANIDKIKHHSLGVSLSLLHLYHGKIWDRRFRTTTTLSVLTKYDSFFGKNIKGFFNPTIKLELFPNFLYGDEFLQSTSVLYRLDYFNYTYKGFNYRHRRTSHSVGVIYYF